MRLIPILMVLASGVSIAVPAVAQSVDTRSLSLELNALSPANGACRVSFVAGNDMGAPISDAAFEVAFFGKDGVLAKLVSLDFKAMPAGKTKVLQFDVEGLDCGNVGRVLVNDVATCDGDGLDPASCLAALKTSAIPEVEFGT
jgi:hypothetical protein